MSVKDKLAASTDITSKKILVIDGHPVYIFKTEGFLQGLTFKNVCLAKSGEEGLQMAESHTPDLIILSGMLPDRDSRQVCQQLKTILPSVKIIVQVGLFTETPIIQQFKDLGANAVLARKEKDLIPLQEQLEKLFS